MIITVHAYTSPHEEYAVSVYGIAMVFPPDPGHPNANRHSTRIMFNNSTNVFQVAESYENIIEQIKAVSSGDYTVGSDFDAGALSELLSTYDNPVTDDGDPSVHNVNTQEPVAANSSGVLRPLPPSILQQIQDDSV